MTRLRSENGHFVDEYNREVLLRGVNLGRKNDPYLPERNEEDYRTIAEWGMNCVRFYVNWAGIEPNPGEYSEEMLRGMDGHIAWANKHGLYVLIDLHQDLYSGAVPGGNGAPAWATLDGGKEHIKGPGPWGVAYFTSPQVHHAFENFWANQPGPDGVGLQDRYAAMAAMLAKRYAGNPGVVGIEIMNEPALGTDIKLLTVALLGALPELMALPDPPKGLLEELLGARGVEGVIGYLEREDIYRWIIESIRPVVNVFEREKLQPFYNRVGSAIRAAAAEPIIFFEPAILVNSGARSAIEIITDNAGTPLSNLAYAPHIYDLVTDTPQVADASPMRLEIMFAHMDAHRETLGLPAVVGEWGAYYGSPNAGPAARMAAELFERHKVGDLYWDYSPGLRDTSFFPQLCKPWPVAVAGTLETWRFDRDTRKLTIEWREDSSANAPTRIFLPSLWYAAQPKASVSPASALRWTPAPQETSGWYLEIDAGVDGTVQLSVEPDGAN